MSMFLIILLFLVGLGLIIKGGDIFVDAATWAADISGIPKFIIGATIVSIATTLPELLVSIFSALQGKVEMSIGNAVGSVTANTALILAISMICLPAITLRKNIWKKSAILIASTLLLTVLTIFDGKLSVFESIIFVILFALSMYESLMAGKKATSEKKMEETVVIHRKEALINVCKFVFGAAGIIIGADLMVDYGSEIARHLGVSEAIIGSTIIAVGTSLPELVTTVTAIIKKQSSLSIGNIIGANVIDITLIMPICAILSGEALPVIGQNQIIDVPAAFIVCSVAIIPVLIRQKYKRTLGFILLGLYAIYLYIIISGCYNAWI